MSRLFLILLSILCFIVIIGLAACYWHRGWVSIANVAALFSIPSSVGVVVSLIFIAQQVKQQTLQAQQQTLQVQQQTRQVELQTKLAKAANSQSFVNVAATFVLGVGSNKELMNFYQNGGTNFKTLSAAEKVQYRYLISWWLTFFENVQYQEDCGLLDESVYKAWMKDMEAFFRRRRVDLVWEDLKGNYSESFVNRFQKSIDNVAKEFEEKQP